MSYAAKEQPAPRPNNAKSAHSSYRDYIKGTRLEPLKTDLWSRQQMGIATYGTPLQPHNGRDQLVDAYQELLDAVVYLECAIREKDSVTLRIIQDSIAQQALFLKEVIDRDRAE